MRILFVNEKCGHFGGVEQNVAATAKGLRELGYVCYLAFGTSLSKDFDNYSSFFENVFLCHDISQNGENPSGRKFEDILKEISPDVIYVHNVSQTGFCLPFVNKIRIVRMVHDHDLCCPRKHKYFFYTERICHYPAGWRCYLDMAFAQRGSGDKKRLKYVSIPKKIVEMKRNYKWDALLVGSHFMKQELIQNLFPEDRIHIVAPSVPIKPVATTMPSSQPVILCVAQLIRGKGVDLLLRALKMLSCEFRAYIVGTGNAESGLKKLCHELGLDDKVSFVGWVNNDSIGSYYSNSRVVAVPSRWPEPFGMIGLEAMRHARPVVAFNVGGIPDWLEHEVTGLSVPEQDVAGLASSLERILVDHNLACRLGAASATRAQDNFSFEEYLQKIVKYLEIN